MRKKVSARQLSFPFHFGGPDLDKRLSAELGSRVRVVYTDNTHTMISSGQPGRGVMVVRLHHMFRGADGEIVSALAEYLKRHDRLSSDLLGEFIKENDHLVRRSSRPLRPSIETKGQFHDLALYLKHLNKLYFNGRMNVAISWGHRARRRGQRHIRLGSYSFEHRLIRIHPSLDKKWVPRYYVESIVYHEMLHALFGVRSKNGRSSYHTAAFRERERSFTHFDRVQNWEKNNLRRLL